jgi:CRISPR system Cascade subunit CasE
MIYLSRIILDQRDPQVRRDLADRQALHRSVMRAFSNHAPDDAPARAQLAVLYRVEPLPDTPRYVRLLVQSAAMPQWSQFAATCLGPSPDARGNPAVRRIDDAYAQIVAGAAYTFRLVANPTKRIAMRRDDPLRGKRVHLLHEAEHIAWLARKALDHGFRLAESPSTAGMVAVRATTLPQVHGYRSQADSALLTLGGVRFDGRLTVVDPTVFVAALVHGIGSGKAYGFGLLSIASAD